LREKPAYYAIVPAGVRYDKNICPNAKLLYCEITALSNKEGFCWASNQYFTDLYEVNERTVQNWLSALKEAGYISIELEFLPGSKQVSGRKIFLSDAAPSIQRRPDAPPGKKTFSPPPNTDDKPAAPEPEPDLFQPEPIPESPRQPAPRQDSPPGENFFTTPPKKDSPPGEKIFTQNITSINIQGAATTAAPPPGPEKPPDSAAAAALSTTAGKIRAECLAVDPILVFDRDFYPRAAAFLAQNSLDLRYIAWLRSYCESKNPRTLTGMFFKIFFADNVAALYRAERDREQRLRDSAAPPEPTLCPVCGHRFLPGEDTCPACRLPVQDARFGGDDRLARARAFHALPPDQKAAYDRELEALLNGDCDTKTKINTVAEINARYGLPP
jgi:hypothetical protein